MRCARRGFSRNAGYVDERFTRHVPGGPDELVIEDAATGLVWQGCLSGRSGANCDQGSLVEFLPADWRPYCDDLSWAGHDDWRLPTYKELYSLAEYPPANPSEPEVDESVFDIDGVNYLPGTTGWGPDALDVLMDTHDGDRVGPGLDYPILCVRWK